MQDSNSVQTELSSSMLRNERLSSARSRLVSEHLLEYGDGLLHLVQRPVRNAAVRLLERRSVARHEHATVNPPSTTSLKASPRSFMWRSWLAPREELHPSALAPCKIRTRSRPS